MGPGFFVAGCAVDLPSEEQTTNHLGFQAVFQVAWVEVVVLDGIARANDVGVFHPANTAHDLQLHVEWQRCGNAVRIQLMGGQAFRLNEHLMAVFVGKTMNLVFDRRAVTRADTFDHARIHRRTIQVGGNDLVRTGVGVGNPATDLTRMLLLATEERHQRDRRIARLFGHQREIHRTPINARRSAGFQPSNPQRQFA